MNAFIAFNSQRNVDVKHIKQRFRLGDVVEARIVDDSDEWIRVRLIRRNPHGTWDVQVYGLTGGKGIALNVPKSKLRHSQRNQKPEAFAPSYVFYEQNQQRRKLLQEAKKRRQIPQKESKPTSKVISTPQTPRTFFKRDPALRRFAKHLEIPPQKRSRLQTIKSTTFQPINKNSHIVSSDEHLLIDLTSEEPEEIVSQVVSLKESHSPPKRKVSPDVIAHTDDSRHIKPTPPIIEQAGSPIVTESPQKSFFPDAVGSTLKSYDNTFRRRKIENPDLSVSLLEDAQKFDNAAKKTSQLEERRNEKGDKNLNSFASYESLDDSRTQQAPPPMAMKKLSPRNAPKPDIFPSQHPYGPALKSLHSQLIDIVHNPPSFGLKKVDTSKGVELWKKDMKPAAIYLAMTVFPKRLNTVRAALQDIKNRSALYTQMKEFRVLRPGEISLCYESHKCPWPVTDRDFEYVTQQFTQPRTFAIISTSTQEVTHRPPKKHIRGHIFFGAWILKELNDQQTVVYHVSKTDPMGKIPKFALQFSTDVLCQAVRNLRSLM